MGSPGFHSFVIFIKFRKYVLFQGYFNEDQDQHQYFHTAGSIFRPTESIVHVNIDFYYGMSKESVKNPWYESENPSSTTDVKCCMVHKGFSEPHNSKSKYLSIDSMVLEILPAPYKC